MEYLEILIRSAVSFGVLLLFTRLTGRKQLSQITFFDYIVGITIGSITATVSVDRTIPEIDGIIAIAVWCGLPIIIGYVALKSIVFRTFIDGKPRIIIQRGEILRENMKKEKYNMGDLFMQLRDKDIFDISQVEFAILEPNGTLSVLKKSENNCATLKDLNLPGRYTGLMAELIIDGRIITKHLVGINKDTNWLMGELKKKNIDSVYDVVFAGVMNNGQLYVSLRNNMPEENYLL